MSMKRLAVTLTVLLAASVLATVAVAGPTQYASGYWSSGRAEGSSFSSGWWRNAFNKLTDGYDTTVTFIDNNGYGWHETVRNTSMVTYTVWWSSQVKKGHCRANTGYFPGGCWVFN
jgi:hypothetical protein